MTAQGISEILLCQLNRWRDPPRVDMLILKVCMRCKLLELLQMMYMLFKLMVDYIYMFLYMYCSCIFTVTLIRKAMYKNLASICSQEGILANSRIMFLFVLGEAYQVLSDPTQRQAYGAYGKSGISTEFVPQKSSVYVSQYDVHMPEMTVRETVDFSARCQGVGSRTDIMVELSRRENEAGVMPDQEVDAYMKAISTAGLRSTLQTDYILKILGLDICADTIVGDVMIRGISGGQKKRLTTGEMIVGRTKALLMDEITNGLDSSTAYQIVACIQQFVHLNDATALVALLQPAPETFELFNDIILMAEGKIVYHGPRSSALDFFEDCGFRCPQRKGIADFLPEVISRKDQMQCWFPADQSYKYVSVDMFHERFIASPAGKELFTEVSQSYHRSQSDEKSISFDIFSLSNWELFKACMSKEFLLMKRNAFLYIFKNVQLMIIGSIAMTLYLRTRMEVDVLHANYYLGTLFFGLVFLIVDGFPKAALTEIRLTVFFKQRDFYFYPAWAYAIPATILKIPLSVVESLVRTSLTYYVIGYSPEVGR